jgi:hypothetical protein
MSYGVAPALQAAVYQRLSADPALNGLVGTAIYDTMPPGAVPNIYVTLGPEVVRDASDKTGHGATHEFTISVITGEAGFQTAKEAGQAISDALIEAPLTLARGALVSLNFMRARAQRFGRGDRRRLDLTFRARVDDG